MILAAVRIALALVTAAAIGAQLAHAPQFNALRVVNFFSFFTIQSNLFCAFILLTAGLRAFTNRRESELAMPRGAATLYMMITGIVYALLLSGSEEALQTTLPWVNLTLHYVMPLWMVIDWLIDAPLLLLGYAAILWRWLVYPIAYVAYSLVRGAIMGWYPYPFLNTHLHGYPFVSVMILAIAVCGLALGSLLIWIAKRPLFSRRLS